MRGRRLLDPLVQIRDAFEQNSDELHNHFHGRTLGLDHRSIANRGNGLMNRQEALLDKLLIATVVLAKERPQLRRRHFS